MKERKSLIFCKVCGAQILGIYVKCVISTNIIAKSVQ